MYIQIYTQINNTRIIAYTEKVRILAQEKLRALCTNTVATMVRLSATEPIVTAFPDFSRALWMLGPSAASSNAGVTCTWYPPSIDKKAADIAAHAAVTATCSV